MLENPGFFFPSPSHFFSFVSVGGAKYLSKWGWWKLLVSFSVSHVSRFLNLENQAHRSRISVSDGPNQTHKLTVRDFFFFFSLVFWLRIMGWGGELRLWGFRSILPMQNSFCFSFYQIGFLLVPLVWSTGRCWPTDELVRPCVGMNADWLKQLNSKN